MMDGNVVNQCSNVVPSECMQSKLFDLVAQKFITECLEATLDKTIFDEVIGPVAKKYKLEPDKLFKIMFDGMRQRMFESIDIIDDDLGQCLENIQKIKCENPGHIAWRPSGCEQQLRSVDMQHKLSTLDTLENASKALDGELNELKTCVSDGRKYILDTNKLLSEEISELNSLIKHQKFLFETFEKFAMKEDS